MRLRLAAIAIVTFAAACNQVQPSDESSTPAEVANPVPEAAPAVDATSVVDAGRHLWFEPATVRECDPPRRVTVHWDPTGLPGSGSIDIKPVVPAGKPQLVFAVVGRKSGKKETGPWMRGGAEFVLVNHADGSILARSMLEATPCD